MLSSADEQFALATYGYVPSLAPNVVALVFFILLLIAQLALDFKYKVRPNIFGWTGGIALEMMGYIGRVINHSNPQNLSAYQLQLITLILGPPFLMAYIYILLGRLVVVYGKQYSILGPRQYLFVFITCDVVARLLQVAGASVAASAAATDIDLRNTGHDITLAGVVFQVFTTLCFFGLAGSFFYRALNDSPANHNPEYTHVRQNPEFRFLIPAVSASTLLIFVRFVFRIAELANTSIGRTERDFLVCDTLMIFLACLIMVVFHPSLCLGNSFIPLKDKVVSEGESDEELRHQGSQEPVQEVQKEKSGSKSTLSWLNEHRPSKMIRNYFRK